MGQSDMAGGSTRLGLGSSVAPAIASTNRDHRCPFSIHGSCDRANVAVDHADPARALQSELAAGFDRRLALGPDERRAQPEALSPGGQGLCWR